MICGLVVPVSFLVPLGLPEKYAAYIVLVGMVPFEYAAYCVLRSRRAASIVGHELTQALLQRFATQGLWLNAQTGARGLDEAIQLVLVNQAMGLGPRAAARYLEICSELQSRGLTKSDVRPLGIVETSSRAQVSQLDCVDREFSGFPPQSLAPLQVDGR